jgi:hypothetical protein
MKTLFKIIFAAVVIVLLSAIYEQLRLSNMTEQQRSEYELLKQHEVLAEIVADSDRAQNDKLITSLSWSQLKNDKERSTWLLNKAMPWAYGLLVFGVFWVLVQMVLNRRNR